MQTNRFDRLVWVTMAGLILAVAGVWSGWRYFGVAAPEPGNPSGEVGAFGPIAAQFAQPVDATSALRSVAFDPLLVGDYTWEGDRLLFWPLQPLAVGQSYSMQIDKGVQTADGRTILASAAWQVTVRKPQLVYLSPSQAPEMWVDALDGSPARPLTATGGRVYDYAVDASGDSIIYAAQNDQGGTSLWRIGRAGGDAALLLDCGADWCINPAISSRTRQLAFARKTAGITPGSAPGVPRIWILDMASGSMAQLYANPNVTGSEPLFSPDGRWLVFLDGLGQQLRLVELASNQEVLLPSSAGMSAAWSPDGLSLFYNDVLVDETFAHGALYAFYPDSKRVDRLFTDALTPVDAGQAALSPDGVWMLAALGAPEDNARRQLWLLDRVSGALQQITDDPLTSVGAYSWSPASDVAAVQTFAFGSSDARPNIVVWTRATQATTVVAEDATAAKWLP